MSQYQTFPDAPGASRTVEKLTALALPPMAGKRFLDVGCNEGFFCGYALHDGAERAVGIDVSRQFIARARERFPAGEFHAQGWDELPEGPFDVILLASALHYADDQPALVRRLLDHLSPDGVLVLEIGVVSSPNTGWHKVKRDMDERLFPSMGQVRELLSGYAWKWMGPSVTQDGDPVGRHVFHVSRLRPIAYLLVQPPAYGKTTIARGLFQPAGVPVVSGDELLLRISRGKRNAPHALADLLKQTFSPFEVDKCIHGLFEAGLAEEFLGVVLEEAGGSTFAFDAYLPADRHDWLRSRLAVRGYMPVTLGWERIGGGQRSAADAAERAESFFMSLLDGDGAAPDPTVAIPPEGMGFVDDINVREEGLAVRGWYVGARGTAPGEIIVSLGGGALEQRRFERQTRPDVQRHLGLSHSLVGFVVHVALPVEGVAPGMLARLSVRAGDGREGHSLVLPMAGPLVEKIRSGR